MESNDIAKLDSERAEVRLRISEIDLELSGFDTKLSSEQARIRAMNLPENISFNKWMQRKNEMTQERRHLLAERLQLDHRLTRLKLRVAELHNQNPYHRPKCPECGHRLSEDESGIHCDNGHVFSLIRVGKIEGSSALQSQGK